MVSDVHTLANIVFAIFLKLEGLGEDAWKQTSEYIHLTQNTSHHYCIGYLRELNMNEIADLLLNNIIMNIEGAMENELWEEIFEYYSTRGEELDDGITFNELVKKEYEQWLINRMHTNENNFTF